MLHFSALLACFILSLLPPVLASPTQRRQAASSTVYYLQTCVINGTSDRGTSKEGLYVVDYHTGAGLSDAVLSSNISIASKGFLNETFQQFDYNTSFPWYMDLGYEPYAKWAPVQINSAETPTSGFTINGTQLLGPTNTNFGGWLACDWWHGVPQLFYLVADPGSNTVVPASCSRVDLQVIPT